MYRQNHKRLPMFRTVKAEWLVLFAVLLLLLSALMVAYFIWSERGLLIASDIERMRLQALIIDENLSRQFEGVRSALDSTRDAFRANSSCTADCRRLMLQSLKRAMPGVRALVVDQKRGSTPGQSGWRYRLRAFHTVSRQSP